MSYFPHKWVVIDYGEEVGLAPQHYAILAGWYGGFAGSDSWKRSSPVVEWDFKEDDLEVTTESRSKYVLHKGAVGVTMLTQILISDAGLTVVSKWEEIVQKLKENV